MNRLDHSIRYICMHWVVANANCRMQFNGNWQQGSHWNGRPTFQLYLLARTDWRLTINLHSFGLRFLIGTPSQLTVYFSVPCCCCCWVLSCFQMALYDTALTMRTRMFSSREYKQPSLSVRFCCISRMCFFFAVLFVLNRRNCAVFFRRVIVFIVENCKIMLMFGSFHKTFFRCFFWLLSHFTSSLCLSRFRNESINDRNMEWKKKNRKIG